MLDELAGAVIAKRLTERCEHFVLDGKGSAPMPLDVSRSTPERLAEAPELATLEILDCAADVASRALLAASPELLEHDFLLEHATVGLAALPARPPAPPPSRTSASRRCPGPATPSMREPGLLAQPSLLADLLDEGLRAPSVRALVVHDLRDEPRLRIRRQHRGCGHLAGELRTFCGHRRLGPGGSLDLRAVMRRLRLGDVVESVRRLGSPSGSVAAGTLRRAAADRNSKP